MLERGWGFLPGEAIVSTFIAGMPRTNQSRGHDVLGGSVEAIHLNCNVYPDTGSAHEVHSLFRSLDYPTLSVKLLRPCWESYPMIASIFVDVLALDDVST